MLGAGADTWRERPCALGMRGPATAQWLREMGARNLIFSTSARRSPSRRSRRRRLRSQRSRCPWLAGQLREHTRRHLSVGRRACEGIGPAGWVGVAPLTASAPPVMQPPTIGFHRSLVPRAFSTKHSDTEKTAPMTMRFFPHDLLCEPTSFMPRRNCTRRGTPSVSMFAIVELLNGASTAPSAMPATPPTAPAMMAWIVQFSRAATPGSVSGIHCWNGRSSESTMRRAGTAWTAATQCSGVESTHTRSSPLVRSERFVFFLTERNARRGLGVGGRSAEDRSFSAEVAEATPRSRFSQTGRTAARAQRAPAQIGRSGAARPVRPASGARPPARLVPPGRGQGDP